MTPMQMLAELIKAYNINIWYEDDVYRIELTSRHSPTQAHGENNEYECRYAERDLNRAIARAWAGETSDG